MRRLPIFFLLDVSESMIGVPLMALEEGVSRIISSLRRDPGALESVYISVIAFAGKAQVISPLVDLVSFYSPRLPIGGGTALGAALEVLMREIDTRLVKQTATVRGDWKPVIFLITDGQPTDNPQPMIQKWLKNYASGATIVAITLGSGADTNTLHQLTPHVLLYEGSREEDFKQFIDWISRSISTQSQSVESNRGESIINLAKAGDALVLLDEKKPMVSDPNTVVLTGRCQKTHSPYLIKYTRIGTLKSIERFIQKPQYSLEGCFPVTESYFIWSSDFQEEQIDVHSLIGVPGCPYCGNLIAIALCGKCNKIMCINGEGEAICPWCKSQNHFVFSDSDANFDIGRGQG